MKRFDGAAEYGAPVEELDVLRDVYESERELAVGQSVAHETVSAELRELVRSRLGG